jgi:hypothetical protein
MKIFTAALATVLTIGSALYAQTSIERINLTLPNPIVVNGITIPAGSATIQLMRNMGNTLVIVRSESGAHSSVLVNRMDVPESGSQAASVILDEKDGIYSLNRIVLPDHTALQVLDAQ